MKRPLYPAKPTRCRVCQCELWKGQCQQGGCPRYLRGNLLRFKAGSRVVVKDAPSAGVRVVERVYTDVDGGRRLDEPVAGFVSWNVKDLRLARKGER